MNLDLVLDGICKSCMLLCGLATHKPLMILRNGHVIETLLLQEAIEKGFYALR